DYIFPFGNWDTAFLDAEGIQNMASNLGVFGSLQGIVNNRDPFTDKPIYLESDDLDTKIKKIAKYGGVSLSPSAIYHGLNLKSAIEGEVIGFPPNESKKDISQAVERLFGISIYSGGRWAYQQKVTSYQRLIQDLNQSIVRIQTDKNLDSEEKRKSIGDAKDSIKRITKQINELIKMMNTTDGTKANLPETEGANVDITIPPRY
ncbi:hypothetical protein LCGC14_2835530, partial [marine sediment metagenome]